MSSGKNISLHRKSFLFVMSAWALRKFLQKATYGDKRRDIFVFLVANPQYICYLGLLAAFGPDAADLQLCACLRILDDPFVFSCNISCLSAGSGR